MVSNINIFIDTWGWLSLGDAREKKHNIVKAYYKKVRNHDCTVITSDYILDETITLLYKRLYPDTASKALDKIFKAEKMNYLYVARINKHRFETAKQLRLKLHDKPNISFTDITSMVVMQELNIQNIITEDMHFEHVGMNFKLVP